jgi:hypothetical protein
MTVGSGWEWAEGAWWRVAGAAVEGARREATGAGSGAQIRPGGGAGKEAGVNGRNRG